MSRIGKLPITILDGVTVNVNGNTVTVKGPKDELSLTVSNNVEVKVEGNVVHVIRKDETTDSNAKQGLYRQLINNMVVGVKDGFKKQLVVHGVGYKVAKQGDKLVMNLGMSHPVEFSEIKGITLSVDGNNVIVSGANKELVGEVAAKIRAIRPMEPYHGYGIHYATEKVILKPGKAAGKKK